VGQIRPGKLATIKGHSNLTEKNICFGRDISLQNDPGMASILLINPGSSGAVAPGKTILQLPDATPIHSKERFKHYLENQKDYFLDE